MLKFPRICGRSGGLFGLALLLGVGVATPSHAQSAICYDLESRLAGLQKSGSGSKSRNYRRYEQAAKKVRGQLAAAQKKARRAGCRTGGIRLFQKRQCANVSGQVRQLQKELRRVESLRSRAGRAPTNTRRQQRELVVALKRNRCGPQYARANSRNGQRDILDGFERQQSRGYKTVCVRTCDGYYFPISNSSTSRNFGKDEAVCQGKYPGSDVKLFYHPRSGDRAMEQARSVDGKTYSSMPYAFRYREVYDPSCKFNRSKLRQATLKNGTPIAFTARNPRAGEVRFGQNGPIPMPRPALGLDPETQMNMAGDFRPSGLPLAPELVVDPQIRDGQRVRTVGPERYRGQSTAEALTSPALTRIQ